MKKNKILLITILLFSNLIYCAEPGFDDDVVDTPATPIDGWVYFVLATGVFYGLKKNILDTNPKIGK
ncbi:hypothetical protein [Flavobacterium alvei]|uniref:hypothetical protein n=1 Tax=Flavobacterium alvei TaxID=2080416 RepID=UPI0026F18CF1|nr:hypothetical protein [Flavobacterium alvei]